jgi:hypothetical protein
MSAKNGWTLETLFVGSVPKRNGDRNEDCYLVCNENLRFALSDGASVSYDPATWASQLCEKYVGNPNVDAQWITEAVKSYNSTADRDSLPWMKQAAFDRGSFASLLGLCVDLDSEKIDLIAFGDSNVLIMKDGLVVETFPITNVEDFAKSPDLLCTVEGENEYLSEAMIAASMRAFDLTTVVNEDQVSILMATDALSAWVMQCDTDARLNALFAVRSDEQFIELVRESRSIAALKVDDTTMITIRIRRDLPPKH